MAIEKLGDVQITLEPICASSESSVKCAPPLLAKVTRTTLDFILRKSPSIEEAKKGAQRAVIAVQTFKNRFTGPMLYMFTRHYQRLGYAVIVFDRFANHKDVFAENVKEGSSSPSVHYYGYTMFEKMFPNIYNASYNLLQVSCTIVWKSFAKSKNAILSYRLKVSCTLIISRERKVTEYTSKVAILKIKILTKEKLLCMHAYFTLNIQYFFMLIEMNFSIVRQIVNRAATH